VREDQLDDDATLRIRDELRFVEYDETETRQDSAIADGEREEHLEREHREVVLAVHEQRSLICVVARTPHNAQVQPVSVQRGELIILLVHQGAVRQQEDSFPRLIVVASPTTPAAVRTLISAFVSRP
jgi:hypothetical protein